MQMQRADAVGAPCENEGIGQSANGMESGEAALVGRGEGVEKRRRIQSNRIESNRT